MRCWSTTVQQLGHDAAGRGGWSRLTATEGRFAIGSMIDTVGHPHGVVPFARIQVAALAVLVLLGGCDNGSSHAPSPTPSGGVLRVITLGHVSKEHGDPVLNDDLLNRELFRCCLARTLLSYTGEGDAPGTHLVPDLASGFPDVSADRRIWTFHL